MRDLSPDELDVLKQIAQKIKDGIPLEQVEFETADGFTIKITDPELLKAVEKAALEVYEKHWQSSR